MHTYYIILILHHVYLLIGFLLEPLKQIQEYWQEQQEWWSHARTPSCRESTDNHRKVDEQELPH